MKTLILDNYDSYTFNLYQAIAEVNGELPLVVRHDEIDWEDLQALHFDNVVISPGPGRPENPADFGICRQVIEKIDVPLLGVCLGHQGLGYCYGASVIHAPEVCHGRISPIYHREGELFRSIPSPFAAVRYHSLLVADRLPDCLEKIAWTRDGLVMGLRHRHRPLWGVQFHPESIGTEYGKTLLANFREITREWAKTLPKKRTHPQRCGKKTPSPPRHRPPSPTFSLKTRKLEIYPDSEGIFLHLFGKSVNAFWLDSSLVEPELSRFSFMGDSTGVHSLVVRYYARTRELRITRAETVSRQQGSIFEYLQGEIDRRRCRSEALPFDFNGGFVGYFGYELRERGSSGRSSPLPDAIFLLADRLIAVDHRENCLYLVQLLEIGQKDAAETWFDRVQHQLETLPPLPSPPVPSHSAPIEFQLSRSRARYLQDIHQCLGEIREGETYQVCLTNQLQTRTTPDPLAFYRTLRRINPAPYAAFLRYGEIAIASSSPERFLRIDRDGWVETKPIKGTAPRGDTPAEDFRLREQLRHSEKDRAENLMIVDLLRNDLGQVCEVGTIEVPRLMAVETYATVHQLVTTVRGHLRPDRDALDCLQKAFPGGSMTGAPKRRTLEIIDRLEQEARGVYSGAIGYLGLNGAADFNIVIRTAIITPDGTSIGIGGGIVALSHPESEFQETLLKAQALIHALVLTLHGTLTPDSYQIRQETSARGHT